MTASELDPREDTIETKLPRRDWIILPLLGLITVLVILFASEMITRRYFRADDGNDSCKVPDAKLDFRYRANCKAHGKAVDGPLVAYQYNECGYRTKESCGPKPSGTIRIALLGSSTSLGMYVDYSQTFAAQTASSLERTIKRPVEVQNLGRDGCFASCALSRVDEALALDPDLLIIAISPLDVANMRVSGDTKGYVDPQETKGSVLQRMIRGGKAYFTGSGTGAAITHFMTLNDPAFVRSRTLLYLQSYDDPGYLKVPFSPAWQRRFEILDHLLADAAENSNQAKVPVVLIEIPAIHQSGLSRMQGLPSDVEPYAFNERMKQIAAQNGMRFVDGLDAFRPEPEINSLYYVVDGHLNAKGHAIIADALVKELISEPVPPCEVENP